MCRLVLSDQRSKSESAALDADGYPPDGSGQTRARRKAYAELHSGPPLSLHSAPPPRSRHAHTHCAYAEQYVSIKHEAGQCSQIGVPPAPQEAMATGKPSRRLGAEGSENRALLLETAHRVLCEQGYAALTARNVAKEAGLKVQLVYYYFQSMDDLILAMVQTRSDTRLRRFTQALVSPDPLKALWALNREGTHAIATAEILAMANHRETIRTEIVAIAKQFRTLQIAALDRLLADRGVDREQYPTAAIVTIVSALTRAMGQDMALGVAEGYPEAIHVIEQLLDALPPARSPGRPHDDP